MHNLDLENLYSKIKGHIDLVGAHIEDPILIKIIKSCRLKPYSIFNKGFRFDTKYENHWVDEFGNSLKLINKQIKILLNDTEIINKTNISTDLFFGNSIAMTIKNSKFAFIMQGEYLGKDIYFVALYGQDEYFRCFIHSKKWYRISPLLLGTNSLHEIYKYIDSVRVNEISKDRLDFVIPLDVKRCITTPIPTKQSIVQYFDSEIITI
jgi:hypothetical protein